MDELNQVQENVFDDVTPEEENLFADEKETTEPSEAGEESVEARQEETPPSFLKVKYNGEDKELTEEDARTYAQKGMNYDKIYDPIEKLAKRNGLSVSDYLNQLSDTQTQYEIAQEVEKLREDSRYEGISDEILEEIAKSHVTETNIINERNYEEQQKGENAALEAEFKRQVDIFKQEYPDLKPDDLDDRVYEFVRNGYTLLEAFDKYQRLPDVQAKEKASKQNEENQKRSLGNTSNAKKVETDDFLNGFLNG